jgi:hypothetical protein
LNSSTVSVVATPGASKCIIPEKVQLLLDWDASDAYDGAVTEIHLVWATSGVVACKVTENDLFDATGDLRVFATCSMGTNGTAGGIDMDDCDNEALHIKTDAEPYSTQGTSPLDYQVIYHVESYIN